jgi:molybdopterin converting factor subunit 1
MKIRVLCFGITKELLGGFEQSFELAKGSKVIDLKKLLLSKNQTFEKLASLRIAINEEYCQDETEIYENDEVVLIPPVSGG